MISKYNGLTAIEAKNFLQKYGPNSLPVQKKSTLKKFLRWAVSPVSLMLLAAAFLSLFNGSTVDFWIIIVLFFSNFLIAVWHEGKADKSIEKLQKNLSFKVKTLRDNEWTLIDSVELVPGDIIELKIGSIVPADVSIESETNLNIDESVLTGESLPKMKSQNDTAYSGSFVSTGEGVGKIIATGAQTNFGKTISGIDQTPHKSALEKDILLISKFISIISIFIVAILTAVLVAVHAGITSIVTLDLSLLIAGIPVALPTVMSLIISAGVVVLAKKDVIVRRLASLEELANVDLLLSDKTGTLTENKINIEKIIPYGSYDESTVVALAASTVTDFEHSTIDGSVVQKAHELNAPQYEQVNVIPGDSDRKRATSIILFNGKDTTVSFGAPQIVAGLCNADAETNSWLEKTISGAAENGYRAQLISVRVDSKEENNMTIAGILLFADKIRAESKDTIAFMRENGIETKMVTGDNLAISKRVASDIGLQGTVYSRSFLDKGFDFIKTDFNSFAGVAEVLPKDKYNMVVASQKYYSVAATGDGVNDLPAIKAANVGFAVSNAVDALKSTADIVLLSPGIAVIKDAILEARKIFTRLYNYSVYRISESFRVIITIAVIGILYKTYPLTPVQLIILAFLNDIPIVSMAFDRVKTLTRPAHINARNRFVRSILFGMVGIANSLILLFIMMNMLHLPWVIIQTVFFLKLTVSGHMLLYVAHTEEMWFNFLPSRQVIFSTVTTQIIATMLALLGIFVAKISIGLVVLVWVWSLMWMQVSEVVKILHKKITAVA